MSESLFSSSACSSEIIKSGSYGWPSSRLDLISYINTTGQSSEDSAGVVSDDSSTVIHYVQQEPISDAGIINWNQNLPRWSEKLYSHESETLDSGMDYLEITNPDINSTNFSEDPPFSLHHHHQLNLPPATLSMLQRLFDTEPYDDHLKSFQHIKEWDYSPMYSNENSSTFPETCHQHHSTVSRSQFRDGNLKRTSSGNQSASKRPRTQTPSPLPTFKVRKKKLGDRVTALQQLVSPFGKTDIASVLHEATEYINFLQDQVHVLTAPYLKNGSAAQIRQQRHEDGKGDLNSRGLSLVPVSVIFPVASEPSSDLWTPSFRGIFR